MANTSLNFAAQVDDFVRQSERRMLAVFRESAQRTLSLAQQYVPVDTGYLRASLQVSLQSMPQIQSNKTGFARALKSAAPPPVFTLVIANAQLGQVIYAGYTAAYAAHVEYGTERQAPQAYVGRAAAQWQVTVNQVVSELKSRSGV